MPLGLSNRKVADALGVSEGAVRKARADRIRGAVLPDGTLDLAQARALWAQRTDPSMQREAAPAPAPAVQPAPAAPPMSAKPDAPAGAGAADVAKARAFLILENAKIVRVKRLKLEGTAIERGPTKTLVQTLARNLRDGLMGFADNHAPEMAAELGCDEYQLYRVLDAHLRTYIEKTLDHIRAEGLT